MKLSQLIIILIIILPIVSASNINSSVTVIPRPTNDTSSDTNTGGTGVISNEPLSNIANSYTSTKNWIANVTQLYKFNGTIYEIIILPQTSKPDVMVKIETLKDKSANTTLPSLSVYKYLNIYSGIKEFNLSIIYFKVETSWLSDKTTISLIRWHNNEWQTLETSELSHDNDYKYYVSYTNNFSNFVIVGTTITPLPTPSSYLSSSSPASSTPSPTPIPSLILISAQQFPSTPIEDNTTIILIVSILIILLSSLLAYIKRSTLSLHYLNIKTKLEQLFIYYHTQINNYLQYK